MNQIPTKEFRETWNRRRPEHQASLDTQKNVFLVPMDRTLLKQTLVNVANHLENIFNILDDIAIDSNPNADRDAVVRFVKSCREKLTDDYFKINLFNFKRNPWSLNFNIINQYFNTIHQFIKRKASWTLVLGHVNVTKSFLSGIGYDF